MLPQTLHRIAFLFIFLFGIGLGAFAQQGTIAGYVFDQKSDEPLAGVNIGIKDSKKGAATNDKGRFSIADVDPGNYTLIISAVGYSKKELQVSVSDGVTTEIEIALEPTFLELQEVEIVGRSSESYKSDYSFAATKTATLSKNIPQAISVVTKEVLEDQKVYRLNEAVKNISGANQFSVYNDFTLRGFRSSSTRLLNGLKAGFGFWNQPLTPHIERIEVIKGPASALFANTNPGGTINMVTKKPLEISKRSISLSTGSFNTYRATTDLTGPLNDSGTILYRLNVGYEDSDSFRNLQFNKTTLIAPSVSFIPSEKTKVNVDLVYSYNETRLDRGQPIFDQSEDLTSTPVDFSLSQPGDFLNITDFYATASLNHQFSDKFSFNISYLKFSYDEDLEEHRTSNVFLPNDPTTLQLAYIRRNQVRNTDNVTSYFVGKLETGIVQHKALVGFDFNQIDDNRSQWGARGDQFFIVGNDSLPGGNVGNFSLQNPVYTLERNPENYQANWFSQPWLEDPVRSFTYGIYIQDQMKIGGRLQVLVGLRQEFYSDRINQNDGFEIVRQDALIPRFGAVFNLTSNVNVYGTYVQGFEPQSASIIQDEDLFGGPFDPLTSRMVEGGFKGEFLNNGLMVNLALYNLTQNNILVNANAPGNPNLLEQRGQERARGFELDLAGRVSDNLNITANYAYNVAKITESDDADEIGTIKENAPRHQGGFWGKYTIREGVLDGIGLSLGGNFVTERNTFEENLEIPSYAVFDGAVNYQANQLKISVNIYNIFDKTYWRGGYNFGRIFPGEPRYFLANISYSF